MDITLVAIVILCISIISLFFIGREEDKVRSVDVNALIRNMEPDMLLGLAGMLKL